jgi:outer membrane protein TolC
MKIKALSISIIGAINLFAMDINSAIDSAINNNYTLKEQQYILDISKIDVDISKKAYGVRVDLGYNYNNRDKALTTSKEDSTASAKISYNLFNGFKDKYNIDASSDKYLYSKYMYEAFKQDLILEVKRKYINYILMQKNSATFDEEVKLYKRQYQDSLNHHNQGLIAQNDLLEVEVQMLQAKQNLQNAKALENIAKLELEKIIGKKINTNLQAIDFEKSLDINNPTIQNRSELKALKYLISSLENRTSATQSSNYPIIDTSLSMNSYSSQAFDSRDEQTIGSVSVNYNLYNNQKDKLAVLKLKTQVMQNKMVLKELEATLNLQLANTQEQLKVSSLNLVTATKALQSSKLNYEIVQKKLKEGLSSNKDLIDANYLLTKSKQNYFSAYYNRYLSIAQLQRVVEK